VEFTNDAGATMRTALSVLMASAVFAISPVAGNAQPRGGDLPSRVRDVITDRGNAPASRGRDGSWDWERSRDADRSSNRDWERDRDRDRRDDRVYNRGKGRGYGWGISKQEQKAWERSQRDFERRSRNWSRYQWEAYRECERDMYRRSRWDRYDAGQREAMRERIRIRDYCESRVGRMRW